MTMALDRIRAKKPVNNPEKWKKGKIMKLNRETNTVNVETKEGYKEELNITQELLELFTSRMNEPIENGTIWYKKKGG